MCGGGLRTCMKELTALFTRAISNSESAILIPIEQSCHEL
jgi:hypothetical protein